MVGFLSKNPSYPIFYLKYLKNLVKPICGLTKRKKSTWNKKSFKAHIYFFRCSKEKRTLNLNSPHHMKPFNIKIDCFDGRNLHQRQFSLSWNSVPSSLSSTKKKLKKKENKAWYWYIYIYIKLEGPITYRLKR
jgi:hypothetical protein